MRSSKTAPNLSIPDLTHPCDRTAEALFTILIYCGEDEKSKCPLALSSEDMRVSVTYR